MAVAVIFPGQGAQAGGLGLPWTDHQAWELVERAETATGASLAPLLLAPGDAAVARTREAQLVVFLASLLAWEVAGPIIDRSGGPVVAFAGHSLGQVTALVAAGALSFDDGCRLAERRASRTQDAADARPGRLLALLGASVEQAEQACSTAVDGCCWLANDNAPGQVVVGGTPEGIESARARAVELGVRRTVELKVGGAFHTPMMQAAAEAFAVDLASAPFVDTSVPVVSNGDARPYTDAAGWAGRLAEQLVTPVRWAATMPALVAMGATTFVEVGPGSTLTALAKRAVPDVSTRNVAQPFDLPLETANAH